MMTINHKLNNIPQLNLIYKELPPEHQLYYNNQNFLLILF